MHESTPPAAPASSPPFDPIRFCVFTTVALLAWLLGAPVMVMAMSGLGIWAYRRAMRAGLRETKCVLKQPRLVLFYLGAAFALGVVGLVRAVVQRH